MKLHKEYCEIEGCSIKDPIALEWHHIIERTDPETSNHPFNLAVLCSNHHSMVDNGRLKIIGVYPSTHQNGRTLVYILDGIQNIPGIDKPYYQPKLKGFKV